VPDRTSDACERNARDARANICKFTAGSSRQEVANGTAWVKFIALITTWHRHSSNFADKDERKRDIRESTSCFEISKYWITWELHAIDAMQMQIIIWELYEISTRLYCTSKNIKKQASYGKISISWLHIYIIKYTY